MEKIDPDRIPRRVPYIGGEPKPGTIVEMVHRPEKGETIFAICETGKVRYAPTFPAGQNEAYIPYSAQNNLIRNRIILFPSAAEEYESEASLLAAVRAFIRRYVSVSPLFETITAYYVLLTWIFESFGTLPYLRVRGDFGSGKTRFLTVVGSLCFRPVFAGTTTVSPLFRILHTFRGTLVIDEGDFRMSDEKAEITKILNNGNAKGFPVLRSEQVGKGMEFNPVAFDVFGPKVIATRGHYQDTALESRFISEDMGRNRPRGDVPLHLPGSFAKETERLRNQLMMFRFRNMHRFVVTEVAEGILEPRISQIFAPLLCLVEDAGERDNIIALIREYSRELFLDRTMNIESLVVDVISELWRGESLPLKGVTARLNEKFADELQEAVSGKRVGFIIRKQLNLETRKLGGRFEILPTEGARIQNLCKRFGITTGDTGHDFMTL